MQPNKPNLDRPKGAPEPTPVVEDDFEEDSGFGPDEEALLFDLIQQEDDPLGENT